MTTNTVEQIEDTPNPELAWVGQAFTIPTGFAGTMETLDLEKGTTKHWVFRLSKFGQTQGLRPVTVAGQAVMDRLAELRLPETASYASLIAAAAASPALRRRFSDLPSSLLKGAAQTVSAVVCTETMIWALISDPHHPDAALQRLFELDLAQPGRLRAEEMDLAKLGVKGGRLITAIARLGDGLAVAVSDPRRGFDLMLHKPGADRSAFTPLLTLGGNRFAANGAISAMVAVPQALGGGLMIGTAALATALSAPGNWGPELIHLKADGTWDLVFGMPRLTPDGLKRPLSGKRPGLDMARNAAVRAIATGRGPKGRQMVCAALQDFAGLPVEDRRATPADLMIYAGPLRLLASYDLREWFEIRITPPAGMGCVTGMAVSETGILVGHEGTAGQAVPSFLVRF
jgi:hypothetical protein